jgi:hypothetical protein
MIIIETLFNVECDDPRINKIDPIALAPKDFLREIKAYTYTRYRVHQKLKVLIKLQTE